MDDDGVLTLPSDCDVDEQLRRVVARVEALGHVVLAVIDHSGEAAEAGLSMPETKVVLFGNPATTTPLMVAHPEIALDLPLKVLISEHPNGNVFVSYVTADFLRRRYALTNAEVGVLRIIETIAQTARSTT